MLNKILNRQIQNECLSYSIGSESDIYSNDKFPIANPPTKKCNIFYLSVCNTLLFEGKDNKLREKYIFKKYIKIQCFEKSQGGP